MRRFCVVLTQYKIHSLVLKSHFHYCNFQICDTRYLFVLFTMERGLEKHKGEQKMMPELQCASLFYYQNTLYMSIKNKQTLAFTLQVN